MATLTAVPLVPLSEYLSHTYEPDCDFVEGELEERNVGEELHSELQGILARIFSMNRHAWSVRSLTEQRVQVAPDRFRVPDICLVPRSRPRGRVIAYPPLLCVEVLSPDDRLARVQERVNDFVRLGTQHIWVLNPWERVGYTASARGFEQPADGVLQVPGTPVRIILAEVFAELDEL